MRAVYHLKKTGITFNEETASYKSGNLSTIYLKEEIGNFAIHLIQKK
jgi:2-dehydro-3-deoxyphosphogluconate aldolase/(4S)-4-hydroxy-2-oxoglutarate aldolase